MDPTPKILSGSCLCGKVEYQVEDSFHYSQNCHCSDCRRATGSAFKPFAGIERSKLRITAGEASILRYGNGPAFDVHCGACGSLLFSVVRDAAWVHVAMGTLVDAPSVKPSAHIFVGDKAPWFEITDDLPQYEGHVT
jgi:hypothetical protein